MRFAFLKKEPGCHIGATGLLKRRDVDDGFDDLLLDQCKTSRDDGGHNGTHDMVRTLEQVGTAQIRTRNHRRHSV